MAIDVTEVGTPEAPPDGTRAEYGRVWYQGRKVSANTYAKATGSPSTAVAAPKAPKAPEPPAVEGDHLPTTPNILDEFASFAAILGNASASQKRRDEAVDGIDKLLSSLTPGDYPELAEHPVVQRFMGVIEEKRTKEGKRNPGDVVGEGLTRQDIPWRMQDVMERALDPNHPQFEQFKIVEYVFPENTYIGWNGLGTYVFADVPTRIPKVFFDVYAESRKQKMAARQHQDYLFAKRGLMGGSGPETVPADPTIMAGPQGVTSRMLRGKFSGGEFTPGAGLAVEVPDGDRPGYEPGEEGDEGEAA